MGDMLPMAGGTPATDRSAPRDLAHRKGGWMARASARTAPIATRATVYFVFVCLATSVACGEPFASSRSHATQRASIAATVVAVVTVMWRHPLVSAPQFFACGQCARVGVARGVHSESPKTARGW